MAATDREFQAQTGFIAACDDPDTLFEWMREYRESERAAIGRGDEDEANQMDDLAELAEDRIVELKATQIVASRTKARGVEPERAAPAPVPPVVDNSAAELQKVKQELAASQDAQARAEREQARAERERVAAVARAEQREREALAAKVAAETAAAVKAPVAPPLVAQSRSPERGDVRDQVREHERLRLAAIRAQAAQRPAEPAPPRLSPPQPAPERQPAPAPTAPRTAMPAAGAASIPPPIPARTAPPPQAARPTPTVSPLAELPPLARLFRQRLAETLPAMLMGQPEATPPPRARPVAPPPPAPAPSAPTDVMDDVPQHTGADLAAYRAWLGVDQRALAVKFGVGQGTISKGESRPTVVLGPALRKALHEAMSEPGPDVGGVT